MKATRGVVQPDISFDKLCEAAGNVSRETFERLVAFESRFRHWNARINLVSNATLDQFWTRHIIDSAQLIKLGGSAQQWLDLGSGGGFPGLVLAFMLPTPSRIALVDANRKKAAFLSAMVGEFNLPADVFASRIEDVPEKFKSADVVSARALAELPALLALAEPWLSQGSRALFHKGRDYRREVVNSRRFWQFDLIEHASVTDPTSVILEIVNLSRV